MAPNDRDTSIELDTTTPLLHQQRVTLGQAAPKHQNDSAIRDTKDVELRHLDKGDKDDDGGREESCKPTFGSQLWLLTPFLVLHTSAAVSGGFTTILLQYLNHQPVEQIDAINGTQDGACQHHQSSILLVTAEDYAPIAVAILGGFLQQWQGPKRILQVTSVPFIISSILVMIGPGDLWLVIGSRFMAGLSCGLLSSNVYAADMSHREHRQSLKMIEVACRSGGFILIYVLHLCFLGWEDSPRYIALVILFLPIVSFIGLCFKPESSDFYAKTAIRKSNSLNIDSQSSVTHRGETANKEEGNIKSDIVQFFLNVKILGSPILYKPLFFITCIICLTHFSGFSFTKKFLLQILNPPQEDSDPQWAAIAAIAIATIRLFGNLFMSKLVRKTRVRFLFFFSLFSTSISLIILGTLLEDSIVSHTSSQEAIQYSRVFLLSLHIFLIQFGIQNLSSNMTDILFPTKYKSVMKGLTGAIFSLTNIIIISSLTIKVDCHIKYSWTFWIMGSVLLLSSPLLYIFVPEVRNIGKDLAGEFYLPSQTRFYFVFKMDQTRTKQIFNILTSSNASGDTFKREARKIMVAQKISGKRGLCESDIMPSISQSYSHQESVDTFAEEAPSVSFDKEFDNLKVLEQSEINKERVAFVHNIHSQSGYLENNKNERRILIGKGPVQLDQSYLFKNGGLFLFNDIIIISQCISTNLKYVNEVVFKFDDGFDFKVEGKSLIFNNLDGQFFVSVSEEVTAKVWYKYLTILKSNPIK